MVTPAELFAQASQVAVNAHSPYSRVKVGCALLSGTDTVYAGCNVENASYGLTICAERNAIFTAVAAEGNAFRIRELAVVALGLEFPPCGACRQVIAEFADPDAKVWFLQNGHLVSKTVAELLPASFTLHG